MIKKSELCKTCVKSDVCMLDKNIFGDVFVPGNPMMFDNKELYKEYEERKAKCFPCENYLSSADFAKPNIDEINKFIDWLVDCVFNEDDWMEYADAYGELICRKLEKLGYIEYKDNVYIKKGLLI